MLNSIAGVELSKNGYLLSFNDWNEDIARELAKEHKLELSECHWMVIHFMRDYFVEFGIAPEPREVVTKIGQKINPHTKCDKHQLEKLFGGQCEVACKIAGLPDSYCRGC